MNAELKPCPFCGGKPVHESKLGESIWSCNTVPWRRVYCHACEIGTEMTCEGYTPNEVESWNRRAAPDAPAVQDHIAHDLEMVQAEPVNGEALYDAIADSISDLYGCRRVWEAWHVGTMSADDFYPAGECDDAISNVLEAVRPFIHQPAKAVQAEPVAWAIYNGVRKLSVFLQKDLAEDYAKESQKSSDLSGSLDAYHVRPLYLHPPADMADKLAVALRGMTKHGWNAGRVFVDLADYETACAALAEYEQNGGG